MTNTDDLHPDDLQPVIDQLRANRPEATALELDGIKQRVRGRVAAKPSRRRARSADLMKSRLAILSTLVVGMLLSTTGAGLAISGLAGNDKAAVAQYGSPDNSPPPGGGIGGENDNGPGGGGPSEDTPGGGGDVGGEENSSPPGATQESSPLQPTRQVEAGAQTGSGSQLPFTGFAAIPILLGGVALLSVGLVMRRRSSVDRS